MAKLISVVHVRTAMVLVILPGAFDTVTKSALFRFTELRRCLVPSAGTILITAGTILVSAAWRRRRWSLRRILCGCRSE